MRAWDIRARVVRALDNGCVGVLPGLEVDDREGIAGGRPVGRPQRRIGDQPVPPLTVVRIIRTVKALRIDIERFHRTSTRYFESVY
ncbi:hypothetical protein [Microbispora hainanensis]|uniref:Uncharacterized protein n=1 Tax=Microbispora hainanensis TaxID=568844 RepID=A0ABZ1SI19_9ACTN|nr:hypothetical protein [Microbispora hainanensis]